MTEWNGTLTEDMEVRELARVVVEHWHTGAGAMLFIDDLMNACEALDVSPEPFTDVIKAMNTYRHHDPTADVLERSFVPEENIAKVCDLLDQIQSLCVRP